MYDKERNRGASKNKNKGVEKTTENIQYITREIDNDKEPEQIEVQVDPETGKLVEFHRETDEKAA